jgi:hypothetical protein
MMRVLTELLKEGGGEWVVPLAIVAAGFVVVKGIFGLSRSRSQDRKDFLELWAKADKADDLWLQVAVRHLFGDVLPPTLIRRFLTHPQGARALGDLAYAWPFLDMDEATGELRWRSERHYSKRVRLWERRGLIAIYVTVGFAMFGFAWLAVLSGKTFMGCILWVLALESGFIAARAVLRAGRLEDAHASVPRWTKGLRWRHGGPDAKSLPFSEHSTKQNWRKRSA